MKTHKFLLGMFSTLLAFSLTLLGCSDDPVDTDPALAGTVTVSGTAEVEAILTADVSGLTNGSGTPTYQWKQSANADLSSPSPISGATSETYTLVAADQGKYIFVTVTRTGTTGSKDSAGKGPVDPANPNLAGTVTVDGTAEVDSVLTANITGLNGSGTATYQWKRSANADLSSSSLISGATSKTYTLTSDDEGKYVFVTVTRTGKNGTKDSAGTGPIAAASGGPGGPTEINSGAISSLAAPVTSKDPVRNGVTGTNFDVTVSGWATQAGVALTGTNKFAENTVYVATLNLKPKSGYTFKAFTALTSFFTVSGSTSVTLKSTEIEADGSVDVTVLFPKTDTTITSDEMGGLAVPVADTGSPVDKSVIVDVASTAQFTCTGIAYRLTGETTDMLATDNFVAGTGTPPVPNIYTATITLKAETGFTFYGIADASVAGFFAAAKLGISSGTGVTSAVSTRSLDGTTMTVLVTFDGI